MALTEAWVLSRLGLGVEAERAALKAAAQAAGDESILLEAVDILQAGGALACARHLLESALAGQPSPQAPALARSLGQLLSSQGKHDAARAWLERADDDAPGDPQTLVALTLALAPGGQASCAWPRWVRAFKATSRPASLRELAAMVWVHIGETAWAQRCLEGVAPEDEPAGEAGSQAERKARLDRLNAWLRQQPLAERMPSAQVRAEFAAMATNYDADLRAMGNRGTQVLADSLAALGVADGDGLAVLDAGCGTGLCAALLRRCARRLEGFDLSPAMLDAARARGLYDALHEADLGVARTLPDGPFDLIVCCDVLVYFGALKDPLVALAQRLAPGGRLVVIVEAGAPGCGFVQQANARFTHTPEHLLTALAEAGLQASLLSVGETLRLEFHTPVAALVAAGRRHPADPCARVGDLRGQSNPQTVSSDCGSSGRPSQTRGRPPPAGV